MAVFVQLNNESFILCMIYWLCQISVMGQISAFFGHSKYKRHSASVGFAPWLSTRCSALWTPAGGSAPDPRYRFMLPAHHGIKPCQGSVLTKARRLWDHTVLLHYTEVCKALLGPFYGAIAVPYVTRCRCCRCCCGHRCAGSMRQWRRATVATPGEWQCKTGGVRRLTVVNGPNIFHVKHGWWRNRMRWHFSRLRWEVLGGVVVLKYYIASHVMSSDRD